MGDEAIVQVGGDSGRESVVYRASAIGTPCLKQRIAARMEYDPLPTPSKIQAVFDKGHTTEDRLIRQLGWEGIVRQEEVRLPITSTISVVGHTDGRYDGRVKEIKSQSEDEFRKGFENSAFYERYLWQISCYGYASESSVDVLVVRRDEDEAAELEWYEVKFDEMPVPLSEIRKKILTVEARAKEDNLPADCDTIVYPCPYFYLHREIVEADTRLLVEKEDLLVLAYQYKRDGAKEKQIRERRERTKAAIDQAIDGDNTTLWTDDGPLKITFYDGKRSSVSPDLMKLQGINPDEKVPIGFPTAAGSWLKIGDAMKWKSTTTYRGLRITLPS